MPDNFKKAEEAILRAWFFALPLDKDGHGRDMSKPAIDALNSALRELHAMEGFLMTGQAHQG